MFENMDKPQQAMVPQNQQMQDQYYNDPYQLPIDPYIQARPSTNWNKQMLDKLFDPSITAQEISEGEYSMLLRSILSDLRRIPNIAPKDKRRLIRDFADIEALQQCGGTKSQVRSMLREMLFEIAAHSADGSAPLTGITATSAIITQRSQMEQQVKIPQEPQRKKIFGLI
jgi:hypothetical protein